MVSVWRRIAPEANLEALVVMANGAAKLGRWSIGHDRNSHFRWLKAFWQVGFQDQARFFLMRSISR